MKRTALLLRWRWLWAVVAMLALAPQMARAIDGSETVLGGGVIEFTGAAATNRVVNASGGSDFLIVYSNETSATGTISLPGLTQMRILAVGGGGGGAGANVKGFSGDWAGGAGGGAGGFLEEDRLFDKCSLRITVGKGGAAGSIGTNAANMMGKNGEDSIVEQDDIPFMIAYGGGGGGGNAAGLAGASGGGSSRTPTDTYAGGPTNVFGQGFPGGAGDASLYAGGGGGAGAPGEDASTKNPVGGDGRQSGITGELIYYAGGGGGSYGNGYETKAGSIAGGLGGGGRGGYGQKGQPTAGTPGTGGGGGGCRAYGTGKGGAGGSGVVIVRISAAISGALEKPKDQIVVFDGEKHAVVAPTPFYTISGDLDGQAIGTYVAKVKPNAGIEWVGGGDEEVTVMLAITAADSLSGSEKVTGGGTITYAGASEVTWVDDPETGRKDLLLKYMAACPGSFKLPGKAVARVLAVGGGGGGAGANKNGFQGQYGSGGGGGGGGFVEVTNMLSAAVYAVKVGEGGAAGSIGTASANWPGGNGGDTIIRMNGTDWMTAYGGGGGGGHGKGRDGASGGGGSRSTSSTYDGGTTNVFGQGFPGGKGDEPLYGGGGGGAGAPGEDASSKNPVGGDGRQSDITGEPIYYGGGGGGSYGNGYETGAGSIAGGLGGGGKGGYGQKGMPTSGTEGLGGGGGGCRAWASGKAGAGGSGVVYVRISLAFDGDIVRPVTPQEYVYDGNAHTSVVESLAYTIDGPTVGTNVAEYVATVTLLEGLNWRGGGDEPVTVRMNIAKAQVEFLSFVQKDWMYGTPDAATPKPKCTLNLPDVPVTYAYAEAEEGPYGPFKPTEVGVHWIKATVEGTANYEGAERTTSFEIVKGLGDIFIDYVEITIDGYTGIDPSVLVNYPYKLTLAEGDPNGFLYSRAGPTGKGMAFTDKDGNVLPYEIAKWDVDGTSTVYVRIPQIGADAQVIRLYWLVRAGAVAPGNHAELVWEDWTKEEYAKITDPPAHGFDFVVRNGNRVNFWEIRPELTKTVWDERDPEPGAIKVQGKLKYGAADWHVASALDPTVTYGQVFPTAGGAYRVIWEYVDPEGEFELFEDHIDFTVFGHNAIDVFGDEVQTTLGGRVMLANDESAEGHAADYQSYWHVRETDGKLNDLFWEHLGTHDCYEDYILPGYSHMLYYVDPASQETNLLWRLEDVLIGNLLMKSTPISKTSARCFLPWSATSGPISAPGLEPGLAEEAGNIILRNKIGAAVYSPIYTNGIGTIYFDAVNGTTTGLPADYYRIRVDVAYGETADDIRTVRDEDWETCTLLPLKRDNTEYFAACPETKALSLDIRNDKSTNNFYRVCANVEKRGAVRFRIYRETVLLTSSGVPYRADLSGFILLDNIIVSYPRNAVKMQPYGVYDGSRKGRQILGQEAAMTVPFPAVGGVSVRGRGRVETYVNPQCTVDPATFVGKATLHYRWRYLDQATNGWTDVELWPGEDFVAKTAFSLPAKEGDIEFFYEARTQVPYYRYYDYSGLGIGIDPSLYTEEVQYVTNRMTVAEREGKALPSAGTDWFFRLRPGRSDCEAYRICVQGRDEPYEMELVSDRTWRGRIPTREAVEGGIKVRIEEVNRQVAGDTEFVRKVSYHRFAGNETIVPWATTTLIPGSGPDDWSTVACDALTGYLMIQFEEDTRGVSVVHADYQDFDKWSDANRKDGQGLFVGTSADTNSVDMSGSGQGTREFAAGLDWWHLSCPTSSFWTESFLVDEQEMQPGEKWETYKPFTSAKTPNGFTAGNGQWVTGSYRDTKTGMAYQMAGKGNGYLQFVNSVEAPRGIESVDFSVRLGQGIGFDDFSYYDGGEKPRMTNYTFVTRAAYDLKKRTTFTGNASVSVVAGYRPGVGCYEFRVEQSDATLVPDSDQVKGPGNTHRLSLHRWRYDEASGEIVSKELGSTTVANGESMMHTEGEHGSFSALFITLDVRAGETRVAAGVSKNMASASTFTGTTFKWLYLVDKDEDRLDKGGTYGVLTANCPGRFIAPVYCSVATGLPSDAANTVKTKEQTFNYPATSYRTMCKDDLRNEMWVIQPWRMVRFDDNDAYYYGIDATVPEQPIEVYTAPVGTDKWTLLLSTNVTTFGQPGDAGRMRFDVWSREDCGIRISSGTSGKSERNGIVIDDVEIRQWRGESYDDREGATYFPDIRYGSPSNFVFTQSWIVPGEWGKTNCQLVARRSLPDVATSIRSPLMDGNAAEGRGIGLGMFAFTYTNAQPNVNLLLQISTNGLNETYLATETRAATSGYWTTVTNYSFAGLSDAERAYGSRSYYFGLHGVKGAMRLIMDPETVSEIGDGRDPESFGSIEITGVLCRDEPKLDAASWWGWNIRTTDELGRMSLCDNAADPEKRGMSFGLNNSVTDGIRSNDVRQAALYPEHLPFLQTPTFGSETVGQVSFKARKYDTRDAAALLTLYGAKRGVAETGADPEWKPLACWTVTNDLYESYTFKAQSGDKYSAFRFAVTGVEDVKRPTMPEDKFPTSPCARVLVDEVLVMEAVRATVSFRNVSAFRTDLDNVMPVMNIMDRIQQPLCNEDWGVQAEVYAAQLADEVDLSTARVRLWWWEGVTPWGFDRWKEKAAAKGQCAWLAECEGTNLVFRSSHIAARDAVVRASAKPTTVQYMLEVVYQNRDGSEGTSWLGDNEGDWKTPAWYAPLDYNAEYGGGADGNFSAYTILDTVSPGWAWINEINIFAGFDNRGNNLDKAYQFVEIAAPDDADLTDWTLVFLDAVVKSDRVITNVVAQFGQSGLPGIKNKPGMDPVSKCVFHVIASPNVVNFSAPDGEIDGRWKIRNSCSSVSSSGEISTSYPLAIQLVRPSGIVEHELVAIGTNEWASFDDAYDPEKHVEYLNRKERGARYFCAPMDCAGKESPSAERSRSIGVFAGSGETFMQWNNSNTMTPGRINAGQTISPDRPHPLGTALMIYSVIDGPHLTQTFGDADRTNSIVSLIFRKGDENGTNITYHVDKWYELANVQTNWHDADLPAPQGLDYTFNVGKNASNDITVVAGAAIKAELREKYGLGPDNRYRDAIMSWLSGGRTKYGAFSGPNKDSEKIGLAEFHSIDKFHTLVTNLSLKAMYWLDIDPTWNDGDIWFMGGVSDIDVSSKAPDLSVKVKLVITNTSDLAVAGRGPGKTYWAPYVLQSDVPGVSSWDYLNSGWSWSNVTFKVTGLLQNGLTRVDLRNSWLPLRWFVFDENSFDDDFESVIGIVDPFSTASPGFSAGWYKWVQDHPDDPKPSVWFQWDIDDRLKPVGVECLRPENPVR